MKTRLALVAFAVIAVGASEAAAHFPWVAIEKDHHVQVWFSELAEPDNAELLDRIAKINVWTRSSKGDKQPVASLTKKVASDGGGALVAPAPTGASAASAYINYGVLDRGGERFLLQYHAKYLDAGASDFPMLARDQALAFDIVPLRADKAFDLTVLFNGKQAAGAEVVIFDSVSAETTAKTDDSGRVNMPITKPGLYSIRAKWVLKEAGKLGDQEYPRVNHYSTLALRVP